MLKIILVLCLRSVIDVLGGTLHPRLDGRIVGGSTTTVEEYPYQVSILYSNAHICGGSIISSNVVLTAAHCMVYFTPAYQVRVGTSSRLSGGTIHEIYSIAHHANFDGRTYDYDVAVIRVTESFAFSSQVQPVQLAVDGYIPSDGVTSIVTGWGTTTEIGLAANLLQVVEVPIVSNDNCISSYPGLTDTMICAGFSTGGKDACQGDSGGPLVITNEAGQRIQVGIVSWGNGCARPNYPGVYASVGALRSWIAGNSGV